MSLLSSDSVRASHMNQFGKDSKVVVGKERLELQKTKSLCVDSHHQGMSGYARHTQSSAQKQSFVGSTSKQGGGRRNDGLNKSHVDGIYDPEFFGPSDISLSKGPSQVSPVARASAAKRNSSASSYSMLAQAQ